MPHFLLGLFGPEIQHADTISHVWTFAACPAGGSNSASLPSPGPSKPASSSCQIKGNISSSGQRIYHVPGSGSYNATRVDLSKGERYFCSEADARAAGWRAAEL